MSKISRDDILQLIPAYVLDALDDEERDEVEVLLTVDSEAQAMLQQYRQIESVLPLMAVHRQPMPDLKDRLVERLHDAPMSHADPDNITLFKEKPKRAPSKQRYLLPTAVAMLVVLSGVIFAMFSLNNQPTAESVYYDLANQADVARVNVDASADRPVEGELLISSDGERAAIRLRKVPEINVDQAFQLWMIDDEGSNNGGVYRPENNYALYIVVPNEKPIYEYIRFGVSIEPATGSPYGNSASGEGIFRVIVPTYDEQ